MPAYGGPSDALLQALAQAEAQPSRPFRAVAQGAQAGQDIVGGYLQGKQIQQQLEQYRLLSTPLGSMYSDPSQIPFGLSPQHTVKDLLTLAPAMENYIPSSLIRGAAGAYGATTDTGPSGGDGGGGASPVAPIQGPATPPSPGGAQGGAVLANIQGTGAGGGSNMPPPPAGGLNLQVPPGGMGMKSFQNVVLPALKAGQEERQFQERQGAEESRFQRGQSAEESRFGRGKMAGVAEEASKNLAQTGTIQDDIDNLRNLYRGYNPTPFLGGIGAHIAAASGAPQKFPSVMNQGAQIQQVAPALGAKINYELTHHFSPGESQLLMANVAPSATDNEANANMKLNNLQRLVQVFKSGDQASINMVASAIAGRPVTAQVPTSQGIGTQAPPNSTTGDPEADAAIQRIQSSGLNPQAKQARIMAVRARSNRGQI
jgi:hypothetical protein